VDQVGQEICVPVDCYKDVLVIAESSLGELDAYQLKHFAQGAGEIQVGWRGKDAVQEELKLIELTMLSPEQMVEVRAEALEVERHAYAISNVYRETSPVEYPAGIAAIDIAQIPLPPTPSVASAGSTAEIVIYASDLPQNALSELDFYDDPASPGGKFISLPNNGYELDAPPENDPHITFTVQVQSGVPYRCWIHMIVGAPKGKSDANLIYVQISDSVDETNNEIFKPGSGSYLTAKGPKQEGWTWVECDRAASEAEPLVYFGTSGEVTVRLQVGAEGVGFDQFLLSSEKFLKEPPPESIVKK
jgi:hypothetical protein